MAVIIQDCREGSAQLESVSVACMLNSIGGLHVGFLYQREDSSRWLSHLAWELVFRNEPAGEQFMCWVNVRISRPNLEILAAVLEEMKSNRDVNYDVRYHGENSYFDQVTWAYIKQEPGLTCATFIMALLRSLHLELFNVSVWPGRLEDKPVLDALISQLEKCGVEPARILAMRSNHQNIRFRPEEVCGAVGEASWPVPFTSAQLLGGEVRDHVWGSPST